VNGPPVDRRRVRELLQQCVQCGLCLATCATYLATGDETLSPRGRLLLLAELADGEGRLPETLEPSVREAFDLCLGCRACETICPSGVPFTLFEAAKTLAERRDPPALHVVRPERMGMLRRLGGAAEAVLRAGLGSRWRRRLEPLPAARRAARLLGSRPAAPSDRELVRLLDRLTGRRSTLAPPPPAPPRERVVLFRGCASGDLLPDSQRRLRQLLAAVGVAVDVPDGQVCCGALDAHGGQPARAARYRQRNVAALAPAVAQSRLLVEAAGCGLELRTYPESLADRVVDAVVLLADLTLPPLRELPLRVAYHDPCHARHGQGIVEEPRRLLRRLPGVEVVEPEEAEVCCGSGGPYALLHPELSAAMGRRKARHLAETGADLVVTANPGCLGQIRDALALEAPELPILPLTDLVWYAALGDAGGDTSCTVDMGQEY